MNRFWLVALLLVTGCNDDSLFGKGADIEVTPSSIDFGVPVPGTPSTRVVTVTNKGAELLRVDSVELAAGSDTVFSFLVEGEAQFPLELGPNDFITVQVVMDAPNPVIYTGTLRVLSNDPDESTVDVSLVGGTGELPDIVVDPISLDFGDVERLTCKPLQLDVRNAGAAPLNITGMNITVFGFGNDYTATPEIFALAPASSQAVTVQLCPSVTGVQLAELEIFSDDPDESTVIVSLIGNGTPPPIASTDMHLRIAWNEAQTDLDLHLIRPNGTFYDIATDCHWQSTSPDWGVLGDPADDPYLDIDDFSGFGPENINLVDPETGSYKVVVHYYGFDGGTGDNGPSNTTASIHLNGSATPTASYPTTITHHQMWEVAWIHWDAAAGTGTVETINTFGTYVP